MKSSEKPNWLYIPQPFASGAEGAAAAYKPIENARGNNVNFIDGFPSIYSSPISNGGKMLTRAEMNAIGRLASQNDYCRACGMIITFDPKLAHKIGGYPKGAVLEFLVGLNYNRVISLVDDNKVDFTGSTDIEQFSDITNGTVDGVNWQFLGNGSIADYRTICDIPNFNWNGTGTGQTESANSDSFMLASFRSPIDGILSVIGSANITLESISTFGISHSGFIVAAKDVTSDSSTGNYDGPLAQQYDIAFSRGSINAVGQDTVSYLSSNAVSYRIQQNHLYLFYIVNVGATVTNSTMKLVVS